MAAVWYRFRAELRTRWVATLVLAVLVGVAAGVVLTAVAGARRTASAYDRMVDQNRAWDVLVNPDNGNESALDPEAVAQLPQVEAFGYMPAMLVGPVDASDLEELFSGSDLARRDRRGRVLRARAPQRPRGQDARSCRALRDPRRRFNRRPVRPRGRGRASRGGAGPGGFRPAREPGGRLRSIQTRRARRAGAARRHRRRDLSQ